MHLITDEEKVGEREDVRCQLMVFAWLAEHLGATATLEEAARVTMDVADELLGWDRCSLDLYEAAHDRVQPILRLETIEGRKVALLPQGAQWPAPPLRSVLEQGQQLIRRRSDESPEAGTIPFELTHHPDLGFLGNRGDSRRNSNSPGNARASQRHRARSSAECQEDNRGRPSRCF